MRVTIVLVSTIFSLVLSCNAQALRSRECVESPRPLLKLFEVIKPPLAGQNSAEVKEFCSSNPHGFSMTSVSPKAPKKPPDCYSSSTGEVVLEIPNLFFNDCADADGYEAKLDHYAYKWASLYSGEFSMVIYNEKHKFIRRGEFKEGSEIFQRADNFKYFTEKVKFIMTRIRNGRYEPETIICISQSTDSNGMACPEELLNRFPDNVSMELLTPKK